MADALPKLPTPKLRFFIERGSWLSSGLQGCLAIGRFTFSVSKMAFLVFICGRLLQQLLLRGGRSGGVRFAWLGLADLLNVLYQQ